MLSLLRPPVIRILLRNDTAPIPMVMRRQDVCWRGLHFCTHHLIRYTFGHVSPSSKRRVKWFNKVFSGILIFLVESSIVVSWWAIILVLIYASSHIGTTVKHLLTVHMRREWLIVLWPLAKISVAGASLVYDMKHWILFLTLEVFNELVKCVVWRGHILRFGRWWFRRRDDSDLRRSHHLGLEQDRVAEVHKVRMMHWLHNQLGWVRLMTQFRFWLFAILRSFRSLVILGEVSGVLQLPYLFIVQGAVISCHTLVCSSQH